MELKILMVATVSRHLEAFHIPYAEELRRRGWVVCAAADGAEKSPSIAGSFDQVFQVPFSRSPFDLRNLRAGAMIRDIVKQGEFNLIHVHTPVAALVTRLAVGPMRRKWGFKLLYTAHGFHFHPHGRPLPNAAFAALEKLGGAFTDVLFVMNRYDFKKAKAMGLAPRLEYVPGVGVDLSFFDPSHVRDEEVARLMGEMSIPSGTPYFVTVAELNPGKRHLDLLKAVSMVEEECRVVLVGDGRMKDAVLLRMEELGIKHRFSFLGFRPIEDVRALLKGARGVIFPSEREGLPRAVVEAMAMGKLVIGADARGTSDLLEDGRGWLYPVGDVQRLASLIERALQEDEALADAGRMAKKYVEKTMDVRALVKRYADLCEELVRS